MIEVTMLEFKLQLVRASQNRQTSAIRWRAGILANSASEYVAFSGPQNRGKQAPFKPR
jgi:hypothetical protein